MGKIVHTHRGGSAFVPTAWARHVPEQLALKEYDLAKRRAPAKILKRLRLGRSALVRGAWEAVEEMLALVEGRKEELLRRVTPPKGARRRQFWRDAHRELYSRLLLAATADGQVGTDPPMTIPHLIEFLGDYRSANEDLPLLVPALAIQELQTALAETYPVQALDTDLIAPKTVLQPRQQEIYDLLRERLLMLRETLPSGVACLDVGCGSGALALVTAQLLAGQGAHVWATDKLPEALATTRLNVAKLAEEGLINAQDVTVTEGGDLYEPVADMRFGLVTFNPPWARRAPRTRLEIARFDPGQRLLRRFLAETPAHLAADGHLLLFYADNAGPEAITTLEEEADAAGLRTVERLSVRIRVSSGWEHIYLYDMVCDQP